MSDRDDEEAVAAVGNTGQSVVPGEESSEESKETTGFLNLQVLATIGGHKVADGQEEESHVEGEEQKEEGDRRSQSAKQQDESEDEPTLDKRS